MTTLQAIAYLDETTPNRYTIQNKQLWLSAVDTAVAAVLGVEPPTYSGGDESLLLPMPYDQAYLRYMEAQVRYHDGCMDGYRTAMDRYERELAAFRAMHRRGSLPERGGRFL